MRKLRKLSLHVLYRVSQQFFYFESNKKKKKRYWFQERMFLYGLCKVTNSKVGVKVTDSKVGVKGFTLGAM